MGKMVLDYLGILISSSKNFSINHGKNDVKLYLKMTVNIIYTDFLRKDDRDFEVKIPKFDSSLAIS